MLKEDIITDLVDFIATQRNFCVSLKRETELIREWALEEGHSLTRGMVRTARNHVTGVIGLSDGSAINHKYWG